MTDFTSAIDDELANGENPNGAGDTTPLPAKPLDIAPAPRPADPFASAIDSVLTEDATRARQNSFAALDGNPDQAAEAKRIGDRLGMTPEAVLHLYDDTRKMAMFNDVNKALHGSNLLQYAFLDPTYARTAIDDLDPLVQMEHAAKRLGDVANDRLLPANNDVFLTPWLRIPKNTARSAAAGPLSLMAGVGGIFEGVAGALGLDEVAKDYQAFRRLSEGNAAWIRGDLSYLPPEERALYSGAESLGTQAVAAPLSIATGSPAPMIWAGTLATGGQAVGQAVDAGLPYGQALLFGAEQGSVEYLTEKTPIGKLFEGIKAGSPLLKIIGEQLVTENVNEQLATHWQDLNEWLTLNPTKTLNDYLQERPDAALQTAIATTFGTVLQSGGVTGAARLAEMRARQVATAQQTGEATAQLFDIANTSKLKGRDPGSFSDTVQAMGEQAGVSEIYMDAQAFNQIMMQQGAGAPALLNQMPSVAAQMPEALAAGSDIRVPIGELVTAVSGSGLEQSFLQNIKTNPDTLSMAQAEQLKVGGDQLRQEVEQVLAAHVEDTAFRDSADRVFETIRGQLDKANRFTPAVNTGYATLVRDFYTVQAGKLGITPEELYQQYPLQIQAQSLPGEAVFGQDEAPEIGAFGPVLREYRHDAAGAVAALKEARAGEAIAALHHPATGDIDLPWGDEGTNASDGYGLAKLLKWHPEVVDNLQEILDGMQVKSKSKNRIRLESPDHEAAIRLEWDGSAKTWLLTAYAKKEGSGQSTRTDIASDRAGDDTARPDTAPEVDIAQRPVDLKTLRQQARGTFTPATNTITLLKNADLSTFLHESGHFFLETYADLAGRENANPEIAKDMGALLKWFGVKDLAAWQKMTLDEKRAHHEKFARGFEAYLFKGEAPNAEVQSLFQRFRSWLLNIYQSAKALNVSLSPEVRGVMDRMLATSDQIDAAERARAYAPIFASAAEAGMTDAEWEGYHGLADRATQAAKEDLQTRSLRDMKWLANAKSRALASLQKEAKAKRAVIQAEVEKEVRAAPVYAAQRFMSHGELPENLTGLNKEQRRNATAAGLESSKMSLPALKELYGEEGNALWRYLPTGKRGFVASNGIAPEMISDIFGFSSPDEMIRSILAAEPEASVIEGMTDQRMLERYGELATPQAIERAAEAAIHNEARGRFIATELTALNKANEARDQTGTDRNGRPLTTNTIVKAAKAFAKTAIARKRIRDIRPAQYTASESKNAREALRALQAGDFDRATTAKRQELVSHYTAREAADAQAFVERSLTYLKKFDKDDVRKKLDAEYVDQIDQLLERYDLRTGQSLAAIDKRASLQKWLEDQRAQGMEPPIPPELVEASQRISYKNLTVEQFTGLVDAVKMIDHLGRLKKKLLTAKDQREFDEIRTEIVDSIEAHAKGTPKELRTRNTTGARLAGFGKQFLASHRKMASLVYQMDGFKDGGPFWNYFIRPMNEAGDTEAVMREKATIELTRIMKPLRDGGRMGGKGIYFPSISTSLNREERLAVALNMGNAGNFQRLVDGGIGGRRWTADHVQEIADTLTESDWQVVQAIWDYFESYRPQIAAKERRVNGVEPEWVEPSPVETKFGTLRGGYYPIKYDTAASARAEQHNEAEAARAQLQGAYTSATTRRSFTKSRADQVVDRPLLLNFSGIYQGLNEIIHDLSWHEWLIDANRILKNKSIDQAMRRNYGPEVVQQFKRAVSDIATGDVGAQSPFERGVNHLRSGATVAGLGWNLTTSLLQPLGLTQSMVRIGPAWVARGAAQWVKQPLGLTNEIYGKSDFMRLRAKTMQREINEIQNRVSGGKSTARSMLDASFFVLIQKAQLVADIPTWQGAYEKAIHSNEPEDRAVALADQAVRDSQGGGQIQDLAAIQRGGPLMKLWTNFYSFFNVAYNLGVERTKATDFKSPGQIASLAVDYILLYSVPAVLGRLMKDAIMHAIGGGDDWDWEEEGKALVAEHLSYLLGLFVGLREVTSVGQRLAGVEEYKTTYGGPAGLRFLQELDKFATQASQGELDRAFWKSATNVAGIAFHLPSGQINRSVDGALAIIDGKTANPAAVVMGAPRR